MHVMYITSSCDRGLLSVTLIFVRDLDVDI